MTLLAERPPTIHQARIAHILAVAAKARVLAALREAEADVIRAQADIDAAAAAIVADDGDLPDWYDGVADTGPWDWCDG